MKILRSYTTLVSITTIGVRVWKILKKKKVFMIRANTMKHMRILEMTLLGPIASWNTMLNTLVKIRKVSR